MFLKEHMQPLLCLYVTIIRPFPSNEDVHYCFFAVMSVFPVSAPHINFVSWNFGFLRIL